MSVSVEVIDVALDLDKAGLIWHPEIGDEVAMRDSLERVSILVDPQGMTPTDLRHTFLWLPTVEQLVLQFEARQAVLYHAGLNQRLSYEVVVKTPHQGLIETVASSLRIAFGRALNELLTQPEPAVH